MAKSKKPSTKKGSRVTPRKDARRSNREYMKDTFRLYDTANEWMDRFMAGYDEIKERVDVPEEVKAKMKEFIDNNQNPFSELVQSQDVIALGIEKCLDNTKLKWNDIEVEVVTGHLAMHTALDAGTARLTEIMSLAAEIAVEIPDDIPKKETISADELSGMTVREVAEKLGVADRRGHDGEQIKSVSPDDVKKIKVTDGAVLAHDKDGQVSRLVSVDNETVEVDPSTVVLPKETKVEEQEEVVTQSMVQREGSVANVD